MNKIFKVIWNHAAQRFVVTSELTKSNGKSSSTTDNRIEPSKALLAIGVAGAALLGSTDSMAATVANPVYDATTGITSGTKEIIENGAKKTVGVPLYISTPEGNTFGGGVLLGNGTSSTTDGGGYVIIGDNAKGNTLAVVIGQKAKTVGQQDVVIGAGAQQLNNATTYSVVIGRDAKAKETSALATVIGYKASAAGVDTLALGTNANAQANLSTAIGSNATSSGVDAIAIGSKANATEAKTTSIGTVSCATVAGALAVGYQARSTGERATSIGFNSGASVIDGIAIGTQSRVNTAADSGIAIGAVAKVTEDRGIAIGRSSLSSNTRSISIGASSQTFGEQSIGIGSRTTAIGLNASAIGTSANSATENSIAIGTNAQAGTNVADTQAQLVAKMKALLTVQEPYTIAQRELTAATSALTSAQTALEKAEAGNNANAITQAQEKVTLAQAAKAAAEAKVETTKAALDAAVAEYKELEETLGVKKDAIAIGTSAVATGEQSIAIGYNNQVTGNYSGAFGDPSIVAGTGAYTLGNDNAVGSTSKNVGAFGNNNQIGATATYTDGKLQTANGLANEVAVENSRVVGNNNYITSSNTYVLGSGIGVKTDGSLFTSKTVENSVYLGNDSTIASGAAVGTKNLTKDDVAGKTTTAGDTGTVKTANVSSIVYGGFAGDTAKGAVTVGSAGEERRIMNVAAGEISKTSTDAINGSQLYLVASHITDNAPFQYVDKDGNPVVKIGDTYYPAGTIVDANGNIVDKDGNAATPIADQNSVVIKAKSTNPENITNVKGNLTPTYNKGDFEIDANDKPTTTAKTDYTKSQPAPTAADVKAMYNNAATVGDVLNAGWNLQGNGSAVDFVKPYDTVNFINGAGTTVKVEANENGNVSTVQVNGLVAVTDKDGNVLIKNGDKWYKADDLVNGTPKADAKPVDASNTQVNLINPSETTNTKGEPTQLGNVKAGTETLSNPVDKNGDQLVKAKDGQYYPAGTELNEDGSVKSADAKPLETQPTANVSNAYSGLADLNGSNATNALTVEDAKKLGWVVSASGNDYADDVRNANRVDFVGEDGVTVEGKTDDNGVRTITTKINVDNKTTEITYKTTTGETVYKVEKKNDDGTTTVTYNTERDGSGTSVTEDQIKNSQISAIIPGMDKGEVVKSNEKTITIDGEKKDVVEVTDNDGNKTYYDKDDIDPTTGKPTDTATALTPDAGTEVENKGSGFVDGNQVADAIQESGFYVSKETDASAVDFNNKEEKINPDDKLKFADGTGTTVSLGTVKQLDDKGEVSTTTVVKVDIDQGTMDVQDGKLVDKSTEAAKDALTQAEKALTDLKADPSTTPEALVDAAQKVIDAQKLLDDLKTKGEDVVNAEAALKTAQDALNALKADENTTPEQLIEAANKALAAEKALEKAQNKVATVQNVVDAINKSGFNLKTSATADGEKVSGSDELINPGDAVEMVAGKNLTVQQDANGKVTFATKDKVAFTEVKLGDTVLNENGLSINNGPSITTSGINAADKKITNVADGEISPTSKDAVNGSQLYNVAQNINNRLGDVNKRIDDVDRAGRRGAAIAGAIGMIPQPHMSGRSMVGVATTSYRGEQALALGYSRISDNSKHIIKFSGSSNMSGKKDMMVGAAYGYQW